jgi:hypothetical protein
LKTENKRPFSLKITYVLLCLPYENITLLFFTFISINCFAQFSKTHYIPPLTAQNNLGDQYLYISTPSTSNLESKIIEIGGNVYTKFITLLLVILYRNRKYYSTIYPKQIQAGPKQ